MARHRASPDGEQFQKLRDWLASLPNQIDYEPAELCASRQGFLHEVCDSISPQIVSAIYLRDEHDGRHFLTLSYAHGIHEIKFAPRRIALAVVPSGAQELYMYDNEPLICFAAHINTTELLCFALSDRQISDSAQHIRSQDLGLAVFFLPAGLRDSELKQVQLRTACRLFSSEIERSRYRRKAMATEEILKITDSSVTRERLCEIVNQFSRSDEVHMFEKHGNLYRTIASTSAKYSDNAKFSLDCSALANLLQSPTPIRSHVCESVIPKELGTLVNDKPWMLVPCNTNALNIPLAQKSRHTQYVLLLVGTKSEEYLTDNFSLTDMQIAQSLVTLLSNHLPYLNLAEAFNEIHEELEKKHLGKFDLPWFSQFAKRFLPSLWSVGIFPEFPSPGASSCHPHAFSVLRGSVQRSRWPQPFDLCTGQNHGGNISCIVASIDTEYHSQQQIVFAFSDRYVPEAQLQILNLLADYARTELSMQDFREHHISVQAQIRHVIRGTLSAAISEVELLQSRIDVFANMPTKLAKLLETPTMRDSMTDTLQWLSEALALVDAPRYLLDSFNSSLVRWSDVRPAAVVRSVLAICKSEMQRRGLRVEFVPDEKEESRQVSADPEFIKMAIFNIVDNAIKYSYQDRYIRIEIKYSEERWRLEVENMGVPIRKSDRKKIFDPFVRSSNYSLATRRPGTGLGLAVCRRILEAHDPNALFDFDSELISDKPPMARTTFFFELSLKGKGEPLA